MSKNIGVGRSAFFYVIAWMNQTRKNSHMTSPRSNKTWKVLMFILVRGSSLSSSLRLFLLNPRMNGKLDSIWDRFPMPNQKNFLAAHFLGSVGWPEPHNLLVPSDEFTKEPTFNVISVIIFCIEIKITKKSCIVNRCISNTTQNDKKTETRFVSSMAMGSAPMFRRKINRRWTSFYMYW